MVQAGTLSALIVDIDHIHSVMIEALLLERSYAPIVCTSIAEAKEALEQSESAFSVAFIALDLPDGEGLELLGEDSPLRDGTEVALLHHADDPFRAMRGIKQCASYFFCKPIDKEFIGTLLDDIRAEQAEIIPEDEDNASCAVDQFELLRGSSPPMRKLYRVIRKIASTNVTVLLVGESGTGKELVAQTIHLRSGVDGPFVAMNCGAIPAELVESELFGHEKGSFSGADKRHAGYFEQAQNGTLFLDELGEMPIGLQIKLLRVLETKRYRRVGGETELALNVRILAATNRDPESAVREGRLREDLYFRIAQFPLNLPALRSRGSDITGLSQYFLKELNTEQGTRKRFSDEAIDALHRYPWPGNVRELKSAVERAYIMAEEIIEPSHLPDEQVAQDSDKRHLHVATDLSLEDTAKQQILATLARVDGNKKAAAEILGISLKTLYSRLREYKEL